MKKQAFNPYLPSWEYIPDGEPYVFGDRVYIYGSHDFYNGYVFCMGDYVCWSAPVDDLGNWRYEGVIYPKTSDPLNRDGKMCLYAPDVTVGPDGRYYKMFMDDSLSINPSQLSDSMENQMNLFTMEHDEEYGDMMNELINIFIPPEDATREELDTAKKNMEKYADYRTYLSFDMQQIIHGEKDMKIGLSKMIKKNSGGEGQNPLYIALLASFAQVYRINLSPKIRRPSTIRLVVLDEAFSKMDAEKVASCISLIRGLGFQAIISATNDKIQNYLENVDKTFVYANPNKKHISIQEFEKVEYDQLKVEE